MKLCFPWKPQVLELSKTACLNIVLKGKPTNNPMRLIPAAAIYGKNGGGKSNVIRAFWFAVQFIKTAQRTQHEKALVPVRPFLLDDYSSDCPSAFEFTYVYDGIKYNYGFSATKDSIVEEHLYHSPKGQKAKVFTRAYQKFDFVTDGHKKKRELIAEAVAPNQLYFAVRLHHERAGLRKCNGMVP